ncbi:MAG: potassium channel family protein [Rhizobiaceae bacterium]
MQEIEPSYVSGEPGKALTLKQRVRELYNGNSDAAQRFRYGLLVFDVVTISFLIFSSFVRWEGTDLVDAVIGVFLAIDLATRFWISRQKKRFFTNFYGIADLAVILSLLAPLLGEGLAFLRILRILRIMRSYQLLKRLRQDFTYFQRNEESMLAALNLIVFLFIMTAVVYETQRYINPKITNYTDALYFTVAALTTTGFGDIVLEGTFGRLLSIVAMIFGVSFFLRLVQVMLRPAKATHKCTRCGLKRHDYDAVHCKACGEFLNIEDEGAV